MIEPKQVLYLNWIGIWKILVFEEGEKPDTEEKALKQLWVADMKAGIKFILIIVLAI